MNKTATSPPQEGGWYEICVRGRLESRWSGWFDGLGLTVADGTTTLRGPVVDQAALHGHLQRLRDLGLPLISLSQVEFATASTSVPVLEPHTDNPGDPS